MKKRKRTPELSTVFVYNYKKRLDRKGKAFVHLRVQTSGKTRYINTGVKISEIEWDERNREVSLEDIFETESTNKHLVEFKQRARTFYTERLRAGTPPSVEQIAKHLEFKESTDFIAWCRDRLNESNKSVKEFRRDNNSLNWLQRFLDEKYGGNLSPKDLRRKLIIEFKDWMLLQKSRIYKNQETAPFLNPGYVKTTLADISRYCTMALDLELIDHHPFTKFVFKRKKKNINWLELKDIVAFYGYDDSGRMGGFRTTRLGFSLSCVTGLRFSDVYPRDENPLFGLRANHVKQTPKGLLIEKFLKKTSNTSAVSVYLPLWELDEMFKGLPTKIIKELIEGKSGNDFLFTQKNPGLVNKQVREIAKLVGIEKYLIYKDSRDTFAINLAINKIPKDKIQIFMGHASSQTTEMYVQFGKKIIQRIFEDKIKSR